MATSFSTTKFAFIEIEICSLLNIAIIICSGQDKVVIFESVDLIPKVIYLIGAEKPVTVGTIPPPLVGWDPQMMIWQL